MAKQKRVVKYKPYPPRKPDTWEWQGIKTVEVDDYGSVSLEDVLNSGAEEMYVEISGSDEYGQSAEITFRKKVEKPAALIEKESKWYEKELAKYKKQLKEYEEWEKEQEAAKVAASKDAEYNTYLRLHKKYGQRQ